MKLIDKDALLAEIERLYKEHSSRECIDEGAVVLDKLEDFIDTLEVKEVNIPSIESYIKEEWNKINTGHTYSIIDSYNIFLGICIYFYELGQVQKGE